MGNLVGMSNAIQRVLMEEELKDISSKVRNGDIIKIILAKGGQYIFEIEGGVGGNFIIKDVNDGKRYTFSNEDFKNDILTVYPYTGGIEKAGGIEHQISHMSIDVAGEIYDIEPIMMGNIEPETPEEEITEPETPEPETPEVVITPEKKEELAQSKADFNARLNESKKDDILFINTGIDTDDGMFEEHAELEFIVINTNNDYIQVNLAGVNGSKGLFYFNNLNNKQIYINKSKLINEVDGTLQLDVMFEDKGTSTSITVKNVISVSNNVKNPINNPSKNVSGISKNKAKSDIELKYGNDIWSKQPGLWDTIKGASPTGIHQVMGILNKSQLNNSYLQVKSKIRFKIIGPNEIKGTYGTLSGTKIKTLIPDKSYRGYIFKDKHIKADGDIDKAHWEIEIMDDIGDNIYKVRYSFCIKENNCTVKSLGKIEITEINNKNNG